MCKDGCTAFFTDAQVFFTTTGLRAIDCEMARRLLPGVEIERLLPGHIVYRLESQTNKYTPTLVSELNEEESNQKKYCIALRNAGWGEAGGVKVLYHANGFLVRAVQPETAALLTAEFMSTLSHADRINILNTVPDGNRLLREWGEDATRYILEDEIGNNEHAIHKYTTISRQLPQYRRLAAARRAYRLHYHLERKIKVPEFHYELPNLAIFEDVILINGQVEKRAKIESTKRTVIWSRQLEHGWYEHVRIRFASHGLGGHGAVVITHSSNPKSIPNDVNRVVSVRVTSMSQSELEHVHFPLPLAKDGAQDQYEITIDQKTWPPHEPRTKPVDPLKFGLAKLGLTQVEGNDGLILANLRIPVLDQLCSVINKCYGTNIKALYSSTTNVGGRSPPGTIVNIRHAPLIASLADEYIETHPFNLTFRKSLGSDIVLPALFQSFYLQLGDYGITGEMYKFDPEMRGCLGDR